jgi:hypothetical protein
MTSGSSSPQRGWQPGDRLTGIENELLSATAAGEMVDRIDGPFDLAAMKA